ncbi:MAG: flagellin [Clostridia bacterium]|nr:flagellin [Clostridia bacterium]
MVVAHNISALNTYKSLGIAGSAMQGSMEKLSSGFKINKAGDDAAGLSISEKMRSQIRGLNQASTNAENGVSMIQTAEGALNEEHSILQRMRELAVQAATDTNASEDRDALQSEFEQLTNEVNRIAATTEFNGMKILNGTKTQQWGKAEGTLSGLTATTEVTKAGTIIGDIWEVKEDTAAGATTLTLQVRDGFETKIDAGTLTVKYAGADKTLTIAAGGASTAGVDNSVYFHVGANSNQVINTDFRNMGAINLGIAIAADEVDADFNDSVNLNDGTGTDLKQKSLLINSRAGANIAIEKVDAAIKKVSEERSKYGAIQNRLEYTMNNLNTTAENMTAAESTIRDVDMAEEMMEYTKNNILQQAAQSMLSQAMARPQQALQLLQG